MKKYNFILSFVMIYTVLTFINFQMLAQNSSKNIVPFFKATDTELNSKQRNLLRVMQDKPTSKSTELVKLESFDIEKCESIILELADSEKLTFTVAKINKRSNDDYTWFGRISERQIITLVKQRDDISATIDIKNKLFKINPIGGGFHAIIQVDQSKFEPEDCFNLGEGDKNNNVKIDNAKSKSLIKRDYLNLTSSGIVPIDVIVAYTTAAKNGSGNINTLIQNAIDDANISYANSDINIEMFLAHAYETSYDDAGKSTALVLDEFRDENDSEIDEIHNLRNEYRADICFLVTSTPRAQAYDIGVGEEDAFAVADYNKISGYRTFAHEIGHLQDAEHNIEVAQTSGYNHGYLVVNSWRTIMSYTSNGGSEPRMNFWSNPEQYWDDIPRGIDGISKNTLRLNETRVSVSNFRTFQLSGTLSMNQTFHNHTFDLTGNLYVPSGYTLKISSSATINLNGYFIKSTGGSIVQENGSTINGLNAYLKYNLTLKGLFPTIQSAISNADDYFTVELLAKTYNENIYLTNNNTIELKGLSVNHTTINGNITITNSTYATVSDLTIGNFKTITVNGGYQTSLSDISFNNTSGSSSINVYSGYSTNLYNLSYIANTTNFAWNFYDTYSYNLGLNTIEGYDVAIYSTSSSDIGIQNSSFCNNLLDFYASSTSSIYGNLITMSYQGAFSGPCSFDVVLGYCGNLSKSNNSQIAKSDVVTNDKLAEVNFAFRVLLADENVNKVNKLSEESKDKIKTVIAKYKNILLEYPSKSETKEVLRKLSACYNMLDEVPIYAEYVSNLIVNKSISDEMERFLIPSMVKTGNYNEAIHLIDEILNYSDISSDLEYELQYEKGTILKYYLNDRGLSEMIFSDLHKKADNHVLAKYAKAQLENQSSLDEGSKPEDDLVLNNNFEISAYPNPFNPSTTLSYQIPKDSFVNLTVYNSLGQVVSTLVNQNQEAGKFNIIFNASNLPSGIYFYSIRTDENSYVKKMMLLK